MTATITARPALARATALIAAGAVPSHRYVRPAAVLVEALADGVESSLCGCDPEPGESCGCEDVSVRLAFRLAPVVKGGKGRSVVAEGDVTLSGGKFQGHDWSWCPDFSRAVGAIIGHDGSPAWREVERAIEAAV